MANEVATKKNAELSTDLMDDIFETAGDGAAFAADEMQIPFVRILQALSPQLNKKKPEYIEGASSGDMFNTVTGEVWDGEEGMLVVPCYQTTKYLEFTPREEGGGFRGEIASDDPILQRTTRVGSKEVLPTGNELVKSDQHYCLIVGKDGAAQPAVVDMKSSQLKVSRRWKTQIAMQKVKNPKTGQQATPALYATMWRISTTEESNDQGSWGNFSIAKEGLVTDRDLFLEAKTFRESIAAGEVKAARDPEHQESQTQSRSTNVDDEIPF